MVKPDVYIWYKVDRVKECLIPFAVLVIEDVRLASSVRRYLSQEYPYPHVWFPISHALRSAYPGRFPPYRDGFGNKLWMDLRLKPLHDHSSGELVQFKDLPFYVL